MSTAVHTSAGPHKDYTGAKMGMWLFLVTELILFGGLFLLYSVYRAKHSGDFHESARELNTMIGTLNTIVLLTSSLTMALTVSAIHHGSKKLAMIFLSITIILAVLFLVNKYFEWGAKISHGIYPDSPELLERSFGQVLYFGLYFSMTGLHALHVLVGIVVLTIVLVSIPRQSTAPGNHPEKEIIRIEDYARVENAGLYWHLVDIIWIFLFPLFYLIT